jgi:hypothetical protein
VEEVVVNKVVLLVKMELVEEELVQIHLHQLVQEIKDILEVLVVILQMPLVVVVVLLVQVEMEMVLLEEMVEMVILIICFHLEYNSAEVVVVLQEYLVQV